MGDTWEWDGTAWTQRMVSGPPARYGAAMASLGGKVVLFGGLGALLYDDTWEWDGQSWTQRDVAGPPARYWASMATFGDRIVLFGGFGGPSNTEFEDTWEWDGQSWTQRTPAASPPTVIDFGTLGMTQIGSTLLLTGVCCNPGMSWEWDGQVWSPIPPSQGFPGLGVNIAALGSTVVAFGALPLTQPLGDGGATAAATAIWNNGRWTYETLPGPVPREYPAMATLRDRVVLFGGGNTDVFDGVDYADTWEWDGTSWTPRSTDGPGPRALCSMAPL
jgi:hypothetical protein